MAIEPPRCSTWTVLRWALNSRGKRRANRGHSPGHRQVEPALAAEGDFESYLGKQHFAEQAGGSAAPWPVGRLISVTADGNSTAPSPTCRSGISSIPKDSKRVETSAVHRAPVRRRDCDAGPNVQFQVNHSASLRCIPPCCFWHTTQAPAVLLLVRFIFPEIGWSWASPRAL